jgi:hypothetical protein
VGSSSQRTELELPIYRQAETQLLTQFPQVVLGHALNVWLAYRNNRIGQHKRRRNGERHIITLQPFQESQKHPGRQKYFGGSTPDKSRFFWPPIADFTESWGAHSSDAELAVPESTKIGASAGRCSAILERIAAVVLRSGDSAG